MKDISHVDVDDVLHALGGTGRYQIIKFLLSTLTWMPESFLGFAIIFLGRANEHTCFNPFNITNETDVTYGSCQITSYTDSNHTEVYNTTSCSHGYQYTNPKDMSIASNFDLVCGKAELVDLSQTMVYIGMGIGSSTLTIASDKFGRKKTCLLSNLSCLLLGIVTSFSPNFIAFVVFRFLTGIFIQGTSLSGITIAIETFPTDKRKIVGAIGMVIWAGWLCLLSAFTYLARDYSWRIVCLVVTSATSYSLIQYWTQDESLRWLIGNNRVKEATAIIKKAAKMNKVDPLKPLSLLYQTESMPLSGDVVTEKKKLGRTISSLNIKMKYSMLDIFKSRRLTCSLLIIWFVWFTNSLVYFGIYLTLSSLAGNMYFNFFLNSIAEIPAAFIYWFTIDRIGRKWTTIMFHVIAAVGLIAATVLRLYEADYEWAGITATVVSLIGKMGIAGSFNVIYFYTPEIFPTNVRNISFGSASTAARIGGMLAPFSSLLAANVPWAPGAIFGGCCLIASFLIMFLPETMGKELPQTMEDLRNLYKK